MILATGIAISQTRLPISNDVTWGPSLAFNKTLLKDKLTLALAANYAKNRTNGSLGEGFDFQKRVGVSMASLNATYTPSKAHSLQLNARFMHRSEPEATQRGGTFTETVFTLTYNYKLATTLWEKK